jgi:hypothetical protein
VVLVRGHSKKIDRAEVLRMVQASYELADDKDEMAENLLYLSATDRRRRDESRVGLPLGGVAAVLSKF